MKSVSATSPSLNRTRNFFYSFWYTSNILPEKMHATSTTQHPLVLPFEDVSTNGVAFYSKDPKNTATFTTVDVIKKHEPICRV